MASCVIYALVVIYNKPCENSPVCRKLQEINNIVVVVVDNSTVQTTNAEFASQRGWIYINMGGNFGLSKAYNRGIESVKENDAIICLFDDDTQVDEEYFDLLMKKAMEEPNTKVFLPMVYDEIGLLSPSVINGLIVSRVTDASKISSENINGINSGMAIRRGVFDNYRYDETYFLDYIDHAFIRDMKRRGVSISIFDAQLKQAFFANSDADVAAVIRRFKIFKKDFKHFCEETSEGRRYYSKEISEQKKAMFLKYKDIRLLLM
jgi:GT2 family glycosyltransferase